VCFIALSFFFLCAKCCPIWCRHVEVTANDKVGRFGGGHGVDGCTSERTWIAPHLHESVNQPLTGNSFSGIQTHCLWQTICILERQLLVSITQNQHWSYSISSSRNRDESSHLAVWVFMTMHQRTSHGSLSKLSATVNLFNWTILPAV